MRCLIVDDSADFVNAARGLLERDGIMVVGMASTSAEALRCFEELRPDVTLVDVNLGSENGFDLAEPLHRSGLPGRSPVIMISTHTEQDFADIIATSPAIGFLSKIALTPDAIRHLVDAATGLEDDDHRHDPAVVDALKLDDARTPMPPESKHSVQQLNSPPY
jgi:DNA-binding NarL/FixJ family response regulator